MESHGGGGEGGVMGSDEWGGRGEGSGLMEGREWCCWAFVVHGCRIIVSHVH